MSPTLQHRVAVATQGGRVVSRRDFIGNAAAAASLAGSAPWWETLCASADELRTRRKACILLWMQGGPSQFETFSPKPQHPNGGGVKALSTNVPGIEVSANFPRCAEIANRLAIVRSLASKEGNHQRATYLLHHGHLPMASVQHPTLGANAARHLGDASRHLPNYVRIGGPLANAGAGGMLGVQYDPLVLGSARRPPENTRPPVEGERFERRLRLMADLQANAATGDEASAADHPRLVAKAAEMIFSPDMDAFDIGRETEAVREAYGESEFAAGCLMARRLIERGVTFVEVVHRGWDTHLDNFAKSSELAAEVDQPMAQLVVDLEARGLLDSTLVVWMGEFGRTPRINPRGGRDHYPRAFNGVLAGAGIRGGQVVGATDPSGSEVVERPVTVNDLFRSVYHALGVNADHENVSRIGRPIKLVDGGEVVRELFS